MARSFNGSTDYGRHAAAAVSDYPFTMATWFYANNTANNYTLMSLCNSGSSTQYFDLSIRGGDAGDPVAAVARNTTYNDATTSTGFSATTWQHACAVFTNSTSRAAYLNGGGKGTDTVSVTYSTAGINRTSIAVLDRSAPIQYFRDLLAHAAIWNVALSDDEVATLADGLCPLYMRPEAIVAYWPLWGNSSPEHDEVGGLHLTLSGSSRSTNNPRIIYPQRNRLIYIPAAGGGGTSVPVFVHHYRMQGAA